MSHNTIQATDLQVQLKNSSHLHTPLVVDLPSRRGKQRAGAQWWPEGVAAGWPAHLPGAQAD
jgi:hypothetical protein